MAPALMEPGELVTLDTLEGSRVAARVAEVSQRNFSRTASGSSPEGMPLFLKQFVGRDGVGRRAIYDDERRGFDAARACFAGEVSIPRTIGYYDEGLITSYEHLDCVPLDIALRRDPGLLQEHWPAVCERLRLFVAMTARADALANELDPLPRKDRDYTSKALAINFKGFEARNLAVVTWPDASGATLAMTAFDLGRPYLAPVEEVAARLLVSVLLLNWGFPLSRFLQGPPTSLADELRVALDGYLHPHAVASELEREARSHQIVTRFGPLWLRALKGGGYATIGARYLRRARRWCRDRDLA